MKGGEGKGRKKGGKGQIKRSAGQPQECGYLSLDRIKRRLRDHSCQFYHRQHLSPACRKKKGKGKKGPFRKRTYSSTSGASAQGEPKRMGEGKERGARGRNSLEGRKRRKGSRARLMTSCSALLRRDSQRKKGGGKEREEKK